MVSKAGLLSAPLAGWMMLALTGNAAAQTVEDRARAAASASQAKTGDSDALQQNYLTPGLSGGSVSTINGATSFSPNLACQKTATMIEILAQPASTGDLGTLSISRDKDLDGTFDEALSMPKPVSGVCANGIIGCDAGTWNNCHNYQWAVGSAGELKLSEVDLSALSACYCINASCGSNLAWTNLATVLKDIGGGVVGALTTADPRIAVTQAAVDGPVIRYTGAQTTSCTSAPAVSVTSYASDASSLTSDANAASQVSSVFQTLAGSPAGLGKSQEMRDCAVTRNLSLQSSTASDIIQRSAGGFASYDYGDGTIAFAMGSPSDNSLSGSCTLYDFHMTLHVTDASRLTSVRLTSWFADDWGQVRIDGKLVSWGPGDWQGNGLPGGVCEQKKTFYAYPNLDLTHYLTNGDHDIWLRVAVALGGETYALISASVDSACHLTETLTDTCVANAADTSCHLYNETVDGVQTFVNGINTGLKPLSQSRIISSSACQQSVTRDFYERDRRYQCVASTATPDLTRGAYIIDHSTETLLADRTTAADGTVTTSNSAFALPDRGTVSSCEAVCKTRAPKVNADAALAGVVGSKQNDAASYDTFYHACTSANTCPLGSGEELVTDCGCIDDFPEAVVMMQSLRLSGADLVCTATQR
ncbi:hypothetical protein [Novosphingobium rosa]|uniref:hypothetical protein n=1 Tax=Novosphingobium rosa TaxID=76978 RepID=UPI000AC6CA65|nr:hypothetical protein [Novosphingobium rosa]